jgi:uncharacterized protein (TIGR03118 family)
VATLYTIGGQTPAATPASLVVTIPPPGGSPAGTVAAPTGIVFNGTTGFVVSNGAKSGPAIFIFDTEDGTISGWNPTANATNAILEVDNSAAGAVYKGLAIGSNANGTFLFATNFNAGRIDVFDKNFKPVTLQAGAFTDNMIPTGFAPFGIQDIGGKIYVTYAMQNAAKHDDVAGPGNGFVDVYDTSGNLLTRLVAHGALNSPWGLALAPANFGTLSNDLLVGNFGDGHVNAFDVNTGAQVGTVADANGNPLTISGLWSLTFGNGGKSGSTNTLNFAAGIGSPTVEANGMLGALQANANLLSGSPNERFVEQVYLDLLNRPADVGGLSIWTSQLDQGISRAQVVASIEASPEYKTVVVQTLYQKLLHRAADPAGLNGWVNFLLQGGTTLQLEAKLIGSPEYFMNRGGGTNMGFLQAVYQDILNRTLDSGGAQSWGQALTNGTSTESVATAIIGSMEAQQDEVNAVYMEFLHRSADPSGLASFSNALANGASLEQVIEAVVGSPEYFAQV